MQIASSDFAAQAQKAAFAAGQGIQSGAKGAAESFNKFVEGQDDKASSAAAGRKADPERKDFWDSFGQPEGFKSLGGASGGGGGGGGGSNSIGTSAMRKTTNPTANPPRKKEDGWGDDW